MATLIHDAELEKQLLAQRRAAGADKYDEVWDGVYVMSPTANDDHQGLQGGFDTVLHIVIEFTGKGKVRPGVNVTDRRKGWKKNYRVPDVAVFLNDTKAENLDTRWLGGPDFGVEIISPDDHTREKIPFYEKVGTRELLIIDRDPWSIELYVRQGDKLILVGKTTLEEPQRLESALLGLTFELVAAKPRPKVRVRRLEAGEEWLL